MISGAVVPVLLASLVFQVRVEGSSICPEPNEVAERLADGAGVTTSGASGRSVARLEGTLEGLRVRLAREDGGVLGDRTLAGEHSCEELADAAAVLISSWLRSPAAPALRVPSPSASLAAPGPRDRPTRFDLGAGGGAAISADGVSPALQASAAAAILTSGLGLRITGVFTGWAETPLGDRGARWRRTSLSLGPRVLAQLVPSWLSGELRAGATVAWLEVEGRGFSPAETRRSSELEWGAAAGGRVDLGRWGWRPFLDVGVAFWPGRNVVYALPDQGASTLPRAQLLMTLGVCHAR